MNNIPKGTESPKFHEYTIQLQDDQTYNIIEETDYVYYLKADEIENGQNTLQSIKYDMSNKSISVRFSGTAPTDETIDWIDKKIDRLLKKIDEPPAY